MNETQNTAFRDCSCGNYRALGLSEWDFGDGDLFGVDTCRREPSSTRFDRLRSRWDRGDRHRTEGRSRRTVRGIAVTSYLTEYERRVGIDNIAEQATAIFGVLSTPKLELAGRTLNPVGEMSAREVVDLIGDSYESIDSIEHIGDETITVLDQSTTRSRFVAEADFAGLPIDLDIHVSEAVERGEGLLVSIGVYPRLYRGLEGDNARTLAEAITAEPATELETDDGSNDDSPTDDSSADSDAETDENDSSGNDSSDDDSGGLLEGL